MIRTLSAADEGAVFDADLCIVGAGAAGLTLAAEMLDSSWRVLVLESGLHEPDAFGEALNSTQCVGLPHDGWRDGRVRAFGGTMRAWGGQLLTMRESELAQRSWVPHSGWPISSRELNPYYLRAERMLGVEAEPAGAALWRQSAPDFDRSFECRYSRWSPLGKRNLGVALRRRVERSRNVTVLLDATATLIRGSTSRNRVEGIDLRSRSGRRAQVKATSYVMCCGGIETPRLMLASNIANGNDLVGRYFQDHVSFNAGLIEPASRPSFQKLFDPRYRASTMFSLKIEPTDGVQTERRWLNSIAHIGYEIPTALGWLEMRSLLRSLQAGRVEWPSFHESVALLRGAGELGKLLLSRYVGKRRRSPSKGRITMMVDVEQVPNPASRIVLDSEVDAFGVPKPRLDWRLTHAEHDTMLGFARATAVELERLRLGKVQLAEAVDFTSRNELGAARDTFHQLGTTRMSRDPSAGVTDTNLRCHEVDNLYVASGAVFPTSGVSNPTFTIIALAMRLADHFKSQVLKAPR